jgi:hypothetical protein
MSVLFQSYRIQLELLYIVKQIAFVTNLTKCAFMYTNLNGKNGRYENS